MLLSGHQGASASQIATTVPVVVNPRVTDTLAVTAVSEGVATLSVLVMSVLTGDHWWIVAAMVMSTS